MATTNQGQNASVATPLAITLTTTAVAAAGDTVFCTVIDTNTTAPTYVITDTVDANPWTLDYDNGNVSSRHVAIFSKVLASSMAIGSVITATPSGGTVITLQGIWVDTKTGAWVKRTSVGPLATSTTTYASPTLAALIGDFAYSVCIAFSTETSMTVAAPFTALGSVFNHNVSMRLAYDDVGSSGNITSLWTINSAHTGAVAILAYIPGATGQLMVTHGISTVVAKLSRRTPVTVISHGVSGGLVPVAKVARKATAIATGRATVTPVLTKNLQQMISHGVSSGLIPVAKVARRATATAVGHSGASITLTKLATSITAIAHGIASFVARVIAGQTVTSVKLQVNANGTSVLSMVPANATIIKVTSTGEVRLAITAPPSGI